MADVGVRQGRCSQGGRAYHTVSASCDGESKRLIPSFGSKKQAGKAFVLSSLLPLVPHGTTPAAVASHSV